MSFAVITYRCCGIVPMLAFCSTYSYGVPGPGGDTSRLYGYVCSAPVVTGFAVGDTEIGTPGPASKSTSSAGPVFAARRNRNPVSSSSAGRGVTQVTLPDAREASTRTVLSAFTVNSGCALNRTSVGLPSASAVQNRPSAL